MVAKGLAQRLFGRKETRTSRPTGQPGTARQRPKRGPSNGRLYVHVQTESNPAVPAAVPAHVMDILRRHSPDSYGMLRDAQQRRLAEVLRTFNHFLEEAGRPNLRPELWLPSRLNVAVHESFHAYAHTFSPGDLALYLQPGSTHCLRVTPCFPVRVIAPLIPEDVRCGDGGRYRTYVDSPHESLSTQQQGFYGLLNEFGAYYHSARVALDLFEYYATRTNSDQEAWTTFIGEYVSVALARLEFKLFMGAYLRYARQHGPDVYRRITRDPAIRTALKEFEWRFRELTGRFRFSLTQIPARCKEQRLAVRDEGEWIMVDAGRSAVGCCTFSAYTRALERELKKPDNARAFMRLY